ncbi:hypothetical protein IE81DRAFT_147608 [Ceraceosorus guamensis]|uniref:Uncharacterized protein n=1 Tax=Ceraceosorus guamensis TaxID=1522189 RepID=A0A316VWS6_9BASI|nr:hypothetical protein IE81DRAFT_147608 [Ceraceosorus guamensis]PWN42097.1 hypothetical protein IE81DRAFT_147608 [Ceraceosorus guamensis]
MNTHVMQGPSLRPTRVRAVAVHTKRNPPRVAALLDASESTTQPSISEHLRVAQLLVATRQHQQVGRRRTRCGLPQGCFELTYPEKLLKSLGSSLLVIHSTHHAIVTTFITIAISTALERPVRPVSITQTPGSLHHKLLLRARALSSRRQTNHLSHSHLFFTSPPPTSHQQPHRRLSYTRLHQGASPSHLFAPSSHILQQACFFQS